MAFVSRLALWQEIDLRVTKFYPYEVFNCSLKRPEYHPFLEFLTNLASEAL